jgi:hypothetical protein
MMRPFRFRGEESVMAKFPVLYRAARSAEDQMASATPEQGQAGMDAWMQWAGKAGGALADLGSPLGSPKAIEKGLSVTGANAGGGHLGGYSIIEAGSMDEAMKLLEGHPHLMTPGGAAITVHEFLAMPGQ